MMHATTSSAQERLSVGDIELEVIHRGAGRPILLLHGMQNVDPQARFLDLLGGRAEIIAPSHPGFGHSARPVDFDTVYDLVHLYLDILETLPYVPTSSSIVTAPLRAERAIRVGAVLEHPAHHRVRAAAGRRHDMRWPRR